MALSTTAGYVDIHAHLLPGIDDGPATLAGALDMAQAAADSGITTIAATPHLRADFPNVQVHDLAYRYRSLQEEIDRVGIGLRVVSGAEVSIGWALDATDEELQLASFGQRGKDLLVETPDEVAVVEPVLFRIRTKGYRITLAHPERSRRFQREPERVELMNEHGILLEVNAEALLFPRRSATRKLAERLCRNGCVNALASDGHRAASHRSVTVLAEGVGAAAALVGKERAEWMACGAPAAIVSGEPLPPAPEIKLGRHGKRTHP